MDDHRGLWRGKRTDNGEWITGYLMRTQGEMGMTVSYIMPAEKSEFDFNDDYVAVGEAWEPISTKTLGECSGVPDKNGKLIFEGDIIKTKKYGKSVGHYNVNDYDIFVVKYEYAVFRLKNHNREFNLVDDGYSQLDVIGNIHDNPELLKGENI